MLSHINYNINKRLFIGYNYDINTNILFIKKIITKILGRKNSYKILSNINILAKTLLNREFLFNIYFNIFN